MADINVDVQLPAPISVDITSPTQSVNANVYVPGPQGPAGPIGPSGVAGPSGAQGAQGNPTEINGLSGSAINLTGVDGNTVFTGSLNLIYISGNSGYFQSQLNSLSSNLNITGDTLQTNINNLSGYVNSQDSVINSNINQLSGLFTGFTGSLDTSYATDADLIATGNVLDIKINTLSGYADTTFSTKTDTQATGSLLNSNINTLSGLAVLLTGNQTINGNKNFNGSITVNSISGTTTFNSLNLVAANGLYGGSINLNAGSGILVPGSLSLNGGPRAGMDPNNGSVFLNGSLVAVNLNTNSYARNFTVYKTGVGGPLENFKVSQNSVNVNNTLTISGVPVTPGSYAASGDAVLVYGNQTVSGNKTFVDSISVSGTGTFNALDLDNVNSLLLSGTNINITGNSILNIYNPVRISGNEVLTGIDLSSYALNSDLISTGQNLSNSINSLSGTLTGNYATINNLALTGSTLTSSINSLSGTLTSTYATISNLQITGSTLDAKINSLSGYSDNTFATITNLGLTGNTLTNNLISTGNTLNSSINSLSGTLTSTYATINNLVSTGNTLVNSINSLSGTLTSNYATITNLQTTGATLDTKINSLSGYVNSQDSSISNNLISTGATLTSSINSLTSNLISTGQTLDAKINNLSGSSVLLYGDQTIDGTKTFRNSVYIHDLYVTGTEFIATTENNFIQSPYLLLNLTGGAVDGGIFFVTGSGLTGINDLGPIIGFDHTDKFKFGISSRASDLSTLNDIAAFQDITAYSGFVDGKYATIINLASTGSTLQNNINTVSSNLITTGNTLENSINSLSGYSNSTFATITNLASTGSTLQTNINTVSSNLVSTGNALEGKISSLSGTLTSTYATISNLASTGSTLNTKIDNLSGYINSSSSNIVFTTGNQIINGSKTFTTGIDIYSGSNPQSLRVFNTTGTNSGEFGLFGWSGNQLVIGSQAINSGISRNVLFTGNNVLISGNNFSVSQDGRLSISGTDNSIYFLPKSAAFPQTSRIYTDASDNLYIDAVLGGGKTLRLGGNTHYIDVNASRVYYQSGPSNYFLLFPDGSNNLTLRNGTNAQTFRVFNTTGTNSGEFGLLGWQNNNLIVGSQATNSGIFRNLILTGNNIDISGNKFRVRGGSSLGIDFAGAGGDGAGISSENYGITIWQGSTVGNRRVTLGSDVAIGSPQAYKWGSTSDPTSTSDLLLSRDAAGILAQRNGTNSQQFRVYNSTGTNSGEFALFGWQNSNLIVGPQQTNSGVLRDMTLTGRNININASGVFNIFDTTNISGNLNVTGNIFLSGNPVLTGVDLSSYATNANLATTGSTLDSKINSLSGSSVLLYGNQNIGGNKTFTGITTFSGQEVNLVDIALNLSGVGDMTFSGTNINFINSPVLISGTNLRVNGDVLANNLVYNTGDQTISGTKDFTSNIRFSGQDILVAPASYLYITGNQISIINGTKYLADTTNGSFGFNLPASPTTGYYLEFADPFYTWSGNNFILSGNGNNVESDAVFTGDIEGASLRAIFVGKTYGWRIKYNL